MNLKSLRKKMGLKLNTENLLVGMLGDSHTIGISSSFNSAISKPLKYLLLPNNKMEQIFSFNFTLRLHKFYLCGYEKIPFTTFSFVCCVLFNRHRRTCLKKRSLTSVVLLRFMNFNQL